MSKTPKNNPGRQALEAAAKDIGIQAALKYPEMKVVVMVKSEGVAGIAISGDASKMTDTEVIQMVCSSASSLGIGDFEVYTEPRSFDENDN